MRLLCLCVLFAATLAAQAPVAENESTRPKDRVKAARSLAKQGFAGLDRLQGLLKDPEVSVRRAAAESIVAIGGPRTLEPLTAALGDSDSDVQRLAINGLVNFYLPGYYQTGWKARLKRGADSFFDYFVETDEPVTPGYVKARPRIIAGLGKIVATDSSMDSRAEAARALGVLRGREASDQLLQALSTKNSDVLYEVLTAFGKIKNPEVAPRLFYLLRDPDEKVQLAAIDTVSQLGNKDANVPLREAWERTKSDKVRRSLLEAMAMLPEEANRPLFEQYLLDQDEDLRAAAAEGLGRLHKEDDRPRLETLWEGERKMRPRLALAFAVVALGNREVSELSPLQYLINTLNHAAWGGVARSFLTELAPDAVVRYSLHNALLQANRAEKMALAQILGARGAKDSVEPLETLAKDTDTEVSAAAIRALRVLRIRLQAAH